MFVRFLFLDLGFQFCHWRPDPSLEGRDLPLVFVHPGNGFVHLFNEFVHVLFILEMDPVRMWFLMEQNSCLLFYGNMGPVLCVYVCAYSAKNPSLNVLYLNAIGKHGPVSRSEIYADENACLMHKFEISMIGTDLKLSAIDTWELFLLFDNAWILILLIQEYPETMLMQWILICY